MAPERQLNELLTTAEMAEADRRATDSGIGGMLLMENAGRAVAGAALAVNRGAPVLVMCGPGNNGGDGFVAARHLQAAGRPVRVALLGDRSRLAGDAAKMAARWSGPVEPLNPDAIRDAGVVVDAIFGAGLSKSVDGVAAETIAALNRSGLPVVAVDVPSGVDGTSGAVREIAVKAMRTVTFFRLKPGHLLFPGREQCGEIRLADIGIPQSVLEAIGVRTYANGPGLWGWNLPVPRADGHKYDRGHVLVFSGGPSNTGAARLAARAALRVGAGLVTIANPGGALAVNAAHLTAIMLIEAEGPGEVDAALSDRRRNALLIGPAAGVGEETRSKTLQILAAGQSTVLDADALTSFAEDPDRLFAAIAAAHGPVVLTPHDGEFQRLFGAPSGGGDASKLGLARAAAQRSGAVIVYKGADTIIAEPGGRAAINADAPAWLATAGSGDVLSGMIAGLLAQHMPPFEAAAAAVWLHGVAAKRFGPGLVAEDIAEQLPGIFTNLV